MNTPEYQSHPAEALLSLDCHPAHKPWTGFLALALACSWGFSAQSGTALDGNHLAYRSAGRACPDNAWCLTQNGFVGTYLRLAEPGKVSVAIRASKNNAATSTLFLGLRIADLATNWPITGTGTNYDSFLQTWRLPAGTYCVRVENTNQPSAGGPGELTIRELNVTGAEILNAPSDANALAAADTYIEHFRKGRANLKLVDETQPLRHAPVRLRLQRHAFNFGTAVSGVAFEDPGGSWLSGSGTNDVNYRAFLLRNFNAFEPENAGKWPYNEARRGTVTLEFLDRLLEFAQGNNLRVRMHGVLWDVDKPAWVKALQDTALHGTTPEQRERAKTELREAISQRIQYFVRQRAQRYFELDVINESFHSPVYERLFGSAGVAGIYNEVKTAAVAARAATRLVPNEFAVFQTSGGTQDPYANWYRQHIETLRNAGGALDGVGIQYYAVDGGPPKIRDPHSPSRIVQVLHNLATLERPLSISEFGVQKFNHPTPERAAEILAETLRVCFGHEKMTSFVSWGFWPERMWPVAPAGALVDAHWQLTPAGKVWQQLTGVQDWALAGLPRWTTDVSLSTDAEGRVSFAGFYGDYEIVSGQQCGSFTLTKGMTNYLIRLSAPEPPSKK